MTLSSVVPQIDKTLDAFTPPSVFTLSKTFREQYAELGYFPVFTQIT